MSHFRALATWTRTGQTKRQKKTLILLSRLDLKQTNKTKTMFHTEPLQELFFTAFNREFRVSQSNQRLQPN